MPEEIREKCEAPDKRCSSLDRRLNKEANTGAGLRLFVISFYEPPYPPGMQYGDSAVAGVVYAKTDKHNDPGVVVNYCPWCGAHIREWLHPFEGK